MPTYNRLASQAGPTMAPAMAAGLEQSTAVAGQQQTQALKSLDAQSTALDSLGPNATFQQVQAKLDEGLKAGWLQPAGAHAVMIGMPQGDDPQSAATRSHILQTIGDQVRTASERLQSQYGTPTMVNVGGQQVPGAINPRGGAMTPAGQPLTNTLSPGEKVQTQPTVAPDGTPGNVNVGSRYNPDGSLKAPGWGNGGRYPTPGTDASKPATPPGFQPTGQAPGQAEAQRLDAENSVAAGKKIYSDADAATGMKSQLLTMESDLAKISTGPTSERAAMVNAFLQKYHLPSTMTADEVASSEGFAKVAKQIALAQAGSLGAGTDEKLTTSLGANPNRDLSKLGNQQILAMLQGNADAIKARGAAYQEWRQQSPAANTNAFLTEFNRTFDPRVYQWGYQIKNMTPAQREAAYNALPDKAQFEKNYNAAVKQRLIDPNAY
jgi:hypothetical protein